MRLLVACRNGQNAPAPECVPNWSPNLLFLVHTLTLTTCNGNIVMVNRSHSGTWIVGGMNRISISSILDQITANT